MVTGGARVKKDARRAPGVLTPPLCTSSGGGGGWQPLCPRYIPHSDSMNSCSRGGRAICCLYSRVQKIARTWEVLYLFFIREGAMYGLDTRGCEISFACYRLLHIVCTWKVFCKYQLCPILSTCCAIPSWTLCHFAPCLGGNSKLIPMPFWSTCHTNSVPNPMPFWKTCVQISRSPHKQ